MTSISELSTVKIIIYFFIGIFFCGIILALIKNTANYVAKYGKIIYLRYIFPMLFAILFRIYGVNFLKKIYSIEIPDYLTNIFCLICIIFPLICLVIKLGIIKGFCFYIIQVIASVFIICIGYASAVLMVIFIAIFTGITFVTDSHYKRIVALYNYSDIRYVTLSNGHIWIDTDGNFYHITENGYLWRQDTAEYYRFWE